MEQWSEMYSVRDGYYKELWSYCIVLNASEIWIESKIIPSAFSVVYRLCLVSTDDGILVYEAWRCLGLKKSGKYLIPTISNDPQFVLPPAMKVAVTGMKTFAVSRNPMDIYISQHLCIWHQTLTMLRRRRRMLRLAPAAALLHLSSWQQVTPGSSHLSCVPHRLFTFSVCSGSI